MVFVTPRGRDVNFTSEKRDLSATHSVFESSTVLCFRCISATWCASAKLIDTMYMAVNQALQISSDCPHFRGFYSPYETRIRSTSVCLGKDLVEVVYDCELRFVSK